MKAWILHGPRDLRLEERELDTKNLGPDDIYVETDFSSLSTGTDRGNYEGAERVPGAPDYPRWVGYNNAGTVMKVGSAVTRFKAGDRVFTLKAHQSAFIIKQTDPIARIPAGVSSEAASMTYLYHLGFHALRTGGLTLPGQVGRLLGDLPRYEAIHAGRDGLLEVGLSATGAPRHAPDTPPPLPQHQRLPPQPRRGRPNQYIQRRGVGEHARNQVNKHTREYQK